MSRIGIMCPPIAGHLNPLSALGRSLTRRGHEVFVLHISDLEKDVRRHGLGFVGLGAEHFPPGTLALSVAELKEASGLRSLQLAVKASCRLTDLILEHAPKAVRDEGIEALLVDQNEPAGATVAEHLHLPFTSVCTSLPLNREPSIPPPFVGWSYSRKPLARLRNQVGYKAADLLIRDIQGTLNRWRKRWGLTPLRSPDDSFSRAAQIAQTTREFDYPYESPSAAFHYTGPWFDDHETAAVHFPWEWLDGRRLIYASLGTLQSSNSEHFHVIAEACSGVDLQTIISVGAKKNASLPVLPGNHTVVPYAPQTELLKRAALTITHGGMNTTMQALHFGSPLVAIPLTHDQPAIAARVERSGAGIVVPPRKLTAQRLRAAIEAILSDNSPWQARAAAMKEASRRAGGVERAADIVEQTMLRVRAKRASA